MWVFSGLALAATDEDDDGDEAADVVFLVEPQASGEQHGGHGGCPQEEAGRASRRELVTCPGGIS